MFASNAWRIAPSVRRAPGFSRHNAEFCIVIRDSLFARSICIDQRLIDDGPWVTEKMQQPGIDFLRVGPNYAMRAALHEVQAGALDELGSALPGGFKRDDPILVAVNHEGWNINACQISAKIFVPSGNTSQTRDCGRSGGDIPTGLYDPLAHALPKEQIGVVEVLEKLREEHVPIRFHRFLNALEYGGIDAVWIVGSFDEVRGNAADDHQIGRAHV